VACVYGARNPWLAPTRISPVGCIVSLVLLLLLVVVVVVVVIVVVVVVVVEMNMI